MIEYDIIEGTTVKELAGKVSAKCLQGWEPLGALAVRMFQPQGYVLYQALVRRKEPGHDHPAHDPAKCALCRHFGATNHTDVTAP